MTGMGRNLKAPDPWDRLENSAYKWSSIRMQELVYSDLPTDAADVIENLIKTRKCRAREMESIKRVDPQTIEVVWYDDASTEHDEMATRVDDRIINRVEEAVQTMFGDHWRVKRKPDGRREGSFRDRGESPQRVLIQRVSHQRFRYQAEDREDYLVALHGRPEGVSDDVMRYADLDEYVWTEDPTQALKKDVYLYESGTGTIHLLWKFRNSLVVLPQSCECGLEVQPEEIVERKNIEHYADYLQREQEEYDGDAPFWSFKLDPKSVIGDDLCGRCWKSYAITQKNLNGHVDGRRPPRTDYKDLLQRPTGADNE